MSKPKKTMKFDSDAALKNVSAVFALLDTVKNAPFTPGVNTLNTIDKSLSDWPESAIKNKIEGSDVIEKNFPDFAKENPTLAATAGILWDIADPSLLIPGGAARGIGKAATKLGFAKAASKADTAKGVIQKLDKVLNPGGVVLEKAGKGLSSVIGNRAAKNYIAETITRGSVRKGADSITDEAEKLAKYAKDKGYSLNVSRAGKLRDILEGPLKETGELGALKRVGGVKNEIGKEVEKVLDLAVASGAPKTVRTEIQKKLQTAVKQANSNLDVSGRRDVAKFAEKLDDTIKPTRTVGERVPTFRPEVDSMPPVPVGEADSKIAKLREELGKAKEARGTRLAEEAQRKAAEAAVEKENRAALTAFEREKAEILKSQEDEALGVLERTRKENTSITAANEKIRKQIESAKATNTAKRKKVDVLQPFQVASDADAETKVAMEIYNKRARKSMKDAVKQADIEGVSPKTIKELEGRIQPLRTAKPDSVVSNLDDLPPPIPRQVDVPPPTPMEGKSVEDLLAELADATAERGALAKTNSAIAKEAADAAAKARKGTIPGGMVTQEVPVESDVKSLWNLRRSIADQLSEINLNMSPSDATTEQARVLREGMLAVEEAIQDSLSKVTGSDGETLLQAYLKAKKDYADAEDFDRFLKVADAVQKRSSSLGIAPNLPTQAARLANETLGSAGQLRLARWLKNVSEDNVTRINAPRVLSEGVQEAAEAGTGVATSPEEDIPVVDFSDVEIMDAADVEFMDLPGRSPQSVAPPEPEPVDFNDVEMVGEDAAKENIVNALAPLPYSMSPYVNEQVLNTPLPRNTDRLMQNPTVLKAKLSQVAPQYIPHLEDTMKNDPEGLRKAAPKIAEMYPAIFERDEYGMFDGKIVNPEMQTKFLADLSQDEGLDSITKATMAMKLRRGEPI